MKLTDLLIEQNIPIAPEGHHHTRPDWLQIDCPFCSQSSNRWLMGVSKITGAVSCYQCGKHSQGETLRLLLPTIPKTTLWDIQKGLQRGLPTPKIAHAGHYQPPPGLGPLLKPHRKYLKSRGFKPGDIEKIWGIRGLGIAGIMSWRIWLPVEQHGIPVSWLSRAIGEGRKRYQAADSTQESIPRSEWLYGADFCGSSVIVNEGALDSWAIGPGAVATCGLAYSTGQLAILSRIPNRYICFDREPEAQKRARELADLLSVFPGITSNIILESGKDAADITEKEKRQLRRLLKG